MLCAGVGMKSVRLRFLQAVHERSAHYCRKRRILAVGFADASHPRVTVHVQHRAENLGDARSKLLTRGNLADLLFQLRIEGGASVDVGRETGRARQHRSAEAFHVEDRRDMMRRELHDQFLPFTLHLQRFPHVLHPAHKKRRHLSRAGRHQHSDALKLFFRKLRRRESKHSDNLPHLFLKGHS